MGKMMREWEAEQRAKREAVEAEQRAKREAVEAAKAPSAQVIPEFLKSSGSICVWHSWQAPEPDLECPWCQMHTARKAAGRSANGPDQGESGAPRQYWP